PVRAPSSWSESTPRPPPPHTFPYTTLFRSHGVGPEVQEHAAAAQYRFAVDQQVDQAGPLARLADVEGPLVALEEDHGQQSPVVGDRKSTRLNSSHVSTSYAVFCSRINSKTI